VNRYNSKKNRLSQGTTHLVGAGIFDQGPSLAGGDTLQDHLRAPADEQDQHGAEHATDPARLPVGAAVDVTRLVDATTHTVVSRTCCER